jgi:hypothetical protein
MKRIHHSTVVVIRVTGIIISLLLSLVVVTIKPPGLIMR